MSGFELSSDIGFSSTTVEVLDRAHERARTECVAHINHHHIVCELLNLIDPKVQAAIERLGIEKDKVWETLTMELFEKTQIPGTEFGPLVKLCLQTSKERAKSRGRHVDPIDLLYGILKTGNRLGALFRTLGIPPKTDLEKVFSEY